MLGRDGQRSGLGDLATTAVRQAVDGHDDRLGELLDPPGERVPAPDELAQRPLGPAGDAGGQGRDVGARAERPLPGAGQDHGADGVVGVDAVEFGEQRVDRRVVEGVELLLPVDGEGDDVLVPLAADGHGRMLRSRPFPGPAPGFTAGRTYRG